MNRNRILKRIVSFTMVLMMLFTSTGIGPTYALSVEDELAPDGQTWEEAYPTGGFLFKESMKYTEEGDDAVQIEVYRMGGRSGKAVADIAVTPVAPQGDTVNAAGFNDFTVTSGDIEPGSYLQNLGEFGSGFLNLVFESGEYKKTLELKAVDDDLSEPEELVLFTIYDAQGAEVIDDGNRFTACIQDDDPYVASSVYFVADDVSFDKSAGFATLDVARSGGIQYVFTVDYETADDSALDGADYAKTSGTLEFKGGVDRQTINIPLINDNIKNSDPDISFKVKLTNPKGGDIAEGQGEVAVWLYNTATQGAVMNIPTLVTDSQSVDISAQASMGEPIATIAEPVTVEPEIKESTPVKEAAPRAAAPMSLSGNGGIGLMSVAVPASWKLAPNQGGWKAFTHLAYDTVDHGFNDADANSDGALDTYVTGGYEYSWEPHTAPCYSTLNPGTGNIGIYMLDRSSSDKQPARIWDVFDASGIDPYGYMIMKSPDIDGMYEFYKGLKFNASVTLSDAYVAGSAANRAGLALTANDAVGASLVDGDRGAVDHLLDNNKLDFINYSGTGYSNNNGERTFSQLKTSLGGSYYNYDRFIMGLRDYCWEDNTVANVNVREMLFERAAISNMQYEVVCRDGDNYLQANSNSVLNAIKPTLSFHNDAGGTDGNGNFYIGSNLVLTAPASAGSFKIKKIEFRKNSGSGWTTINTGSVAPDKLTGTIQLRSGNSGKAGRIADLSWETVDSGQYSLYVEMERTQLVSIDISPDITPKGSNETDAAYKTRVNTLASQITSQFNAATGVSFTSKLTWNGTTPENTRIEGQVTDLSSFDAHLTDGAQLLYGGTMYGGAIPIKQADFMAPKITLLYYDAAAMSREQKVEIKSIESTTLYLDENNNGQVDVGTDTLLAYLGGGRVTNSFFAPAKGKDNAYHQKLIQLNYVKVPKKIILSMADNQNLKYDMKASFITSTTSPSALEKYTNEMKALREINTGDTKVPVYGAAAAKGSITVPLGGDLAPPVFTYDAGSTTKGAWNWAPDFTGNLKTLFSNPAQIMERETVVGNVTIPAIQTNYYLGSFRNTDQIIFNLYDDTGRIIDNYNSVSTYRDPVLGDFSQSQTLSGGVPDGGDNQQVSDTPGAEKPEMNLPDMNIPAGPFEVVVEDNRVGFEVGIPIFGASQNKTGDKTKNEKSGLAGNASKYLDDMKDAVEDGGGDNIFNNIKNFAQATGKGLKPKAEFDASFEFGFNGSFMWAYDAAEARWEFDEARLFVTFNGEVKISQRLPPVPIIYVYIIFSADVEVGLNIDVNEYNDAYGLMHNQVTYTGDINIEVEVEAGVGVGVELCKFEIYLKVNIGLKIQLAATNSDVTEFELGAALGFRAVFLCFTYEMDAISFKLDYEKGRTTGNLDDKQWKFSWSAFGVDQPTQLRSMAALGAGDTGGLNQPPKVRLTMNGRTWESQVIGDGGTQAKGGMMLMSIPTSDGNFELGEYNSDATATQLAEKLSYSSDYKLFSVGGKNYILYVIDGGSGRSTVDANQLVLSEIGGSGLLNPINGMPGAIVVDRFNSGADVDPTGDLNFDANVDGNKIKVVWTDYKTATAESDIGNDLDAVMAANAANTRLKYAEYDLGNSPAAGFNDAYVVEDDTTVYNFLPKVASASDENLTLVVKAKPYTESELNGAEQTFKDNLINQLGASDEDDAKSKYPYFDLKVGNYRYMNTLYGKYSTFSFGVATGSGFATTDLDPTDDWKDAGTRVEQVDLYPVSASEFYMAYTTSYNYLDSSTNMTAKHLYLRKGTIDGSGAVTLDDPLLLRTLVDSDEDTKDGIYSGTTLTTPFTDPFFGGLEFLEGRLSPSPSAENFLLFNMNNRYYVIDEANLNSFIGSSHSGSITPFFELESGEQGDNKGDFSVGADGDGNISAVYTSPIPDTNNNAIFLTKYDPNTGTWGKGVMLAMRGMDTYEQFEDGTLSAEEAKSAYFEDDNKLVFQKPRVVTSTKGALQLVSQTVMTELEEWEDPMAEADPVTGEKAKVKIPKTTTGGIALPSEKGFYAMSFPVGTRKVGFPSLTFTDNTFVPGAVLAPRITFTNVGDFALRADTGKELQILLMLGNQTDAGDTLATWKVAEPVPSGATVDTLLDSLDTVYGQTGTQLLTAALPENLNGKSLYFTVNEDSNYSQAYSYSSLADIAYPTDQNKAELAIGEVSLKQGGEIVTVNGVRYMPLDISAAVYNYSGQTAASNARLTVSYRQTDASGAAIYVPAAVIGTNGTVTLGTGGTIAAGAEVGYITNNSDSKKDGSGNYIIRTDGTLEPETGNDLLVPLSWFDALAPDRSLELKFEASTATPEFDLSNNTAFAGIQPTSTIKADDTIYVIPNEPASFPLEVSSTGGTDPDAGDISLTELATPGTASLLGIKAYNSAENTVTVEANDDGTAILRIADLRTASFKDVIVRATSGIPAAPSINRVLPLNGSAVVYITPPSDTGGGSIVNYRVEAVNTADAKDIKTQYATDTRFEFTGLTNGISYQFRAAAANAQATGPWSGWSAAVTPDAGSNAILDAEYPVISTQPAISKTAELGEAFTLQVGASSPDGGTLSYQWYKNTVNSILGGTAVAGATGAAITTSVGTKGVTYYYCEVTNTNNAALDIKTRSVKSDVAEVSVGKGLPVITTVPTAAAIQAGQKLSDSQLTGGEANVPGAFAWDNPDFVFGAAGDFPVVFAPDDTENYNSVTVMVHVDLAPPQDNSGSRRRSPQIDSSVKIQKTDPGQPVTAAISVTPTVDGSGHATATVSEKSVADAIAKALTEAAALGRTADGISITLDIDLPDKADSLGVVMSPAVLKSLVDAGVKSLKINGKILSLDLDLEALKEIMEQSRGDVTIDLTPVKNLSDEAKELIGTRPVYDVTISYTDNGRTENITTLRQGSAQISIPYTLGADEDPADLFGAYVDENGNAQRIPGSYYDSVTGNIIIPAGHFSVYGVGYQPASDRFMDVTGHWAKESIDFAVDRGLFNGTTDTTFSPNGSMSRGMLVTVLGRLSGADMSGYASSSFTDVAAGKYYLPYIEWAYEQEIIGGLGDNRFMPDSDVTREQMAVILGNYAKAAGITLPSAATAAPFADGGSISGWAKDAASAMQQASIMTGDQSNRFNPKAGATRAEVAAVLHRYINLTAGTDSLSGGQE